MDTSWEESSAWYDKIVADKGHYYHQTVIIPKVLRLLDLKKEDSLLDLACGQGVLARALPSFCSYVGLDASPSLIQQAKTRSPQREFKVADVTKPLPLDKKHSFSHATCILALQNIEHPHAVFKQVASFLKKGAKLVVVLNHPAFRIPRQSSWGIDASKKLQYRRIERYMTPLQIPLQTNPGQKTKGSVTYSFHYPLSTYSQGLLEQGFLIEKIEEWVSDKKSTGSCARMENRSREEFPLFLTLLAQKP